MEISCFGYYVGRNWIEDRQTLINHRNKIDRSLLSLSYCATEGEINKILIPIQNSYYSNVTYFLIFLFLFNSFRLILSIR